MSDNTTTVTKADLAKYLMDKLPVGKEEAEILLNAFLQTIVESLKRRRC